ncbi:hypothetical protein ORJ04_12100 [Rheinheimera baltica]|uniref:RiboL-PSP-HEPN domain-containing protein n=1 Tax=Rheinheimera baltica TaxID=67576 RepID=A0ABT9HZX4_9GAMM|nr:hypothetical protein [Rheinheimera baltica]MDP5136690.1 hypothetical protein [Rheinheimera baltica]
MDNKIYMEAIRNLESLYKSYLMTYKALLKENKIDEEFKKFHIRASLIYNAKIVFTNELLSDIELEAHEYSLRLSEVWFSYEALIPIFEKMNLVLEAKKSKHHSKNVNTIQDALKISRDPIEPTEPYGKANFFNYDFSNTWSVSERLAPDISLFIDNIKSITSEDKLRKKFHEYLYYLENSSLGAQKKLIRNAHNDISNRHDVHPSDVMCIAYAIRNQYVHAGEVISGTEDESKVKCEVIKSCYYFTLITIFTIAEAILWEI